VWTPHGRNEPIVGDAPEIRRLIEAHAAGDSSALDGIVALVYDQLRRLARRHLRRHSPAGRTLDTTGLVHEAYLKLARSPSLRVNDSGHVLAVMACAMRQVLVSRARARLRAKRGGGELAVTLDESAAAGRAPAAEALLDLDRALARLRERDRRLAAIFECRYFGMSEEETAAALGLTLRTVQRGWMRARAWLRVALEGSSPEAELG
jgi:RNA polymerase sigma factor (TIGR02999 family)